METNVVSIRAWSRVVAVGIRGMALMLILASAFPSFADNATKGLAVTPVIPLPESVRSAGSAGVFIGVNEFDADGSLAHLRFAVNDAIAQAHAFVELLSLIEPQNCYLLLAGEPTTPRAREQLAALAARGVRQRGATRGSILSALRQATERQMTEKDLIVFSISTHGFEDKGIAYVMPSDGARPMLFDTGINLLSIQERVASASAGKRLLIVDACREIVEQGGKGGPGAMSGGFFDAFSKARGMSVLLSCSRGQYSIEREELGHGVFTFHLLKALYGSASADGRGYITLGSVADYLKGNVPAWIRQAIPGVPAAALQEPSFKEESGNAREIPLAVSRASAEALQAVEKRRGEALDKIVELRRKQRDLVSIEKQGEMERAVDEGSGKGLDQLLGKLAAVDPANRDNVEMFLAWWDARGRGSVSPAPAPVTAPVATGAVAAVSTPASAPAAGSSGKTRAVVRSNADCSVRLGEGKVFPLGPTQALRWDDLSSGAVPMQVQARGQQWTRTVELESGVENSVRVLLLPRWNEPVVAVGRINSIGMELIRIPSTRIRMARTEVTNEEFRRFRPQHSTGTFDNHSLNEDRMPVGSVNWHDAVAFCEWLTRTEREKGLIAASQRYRLPSDHEWSLAVLLSESASASPQEKDGKIQIWYPWGALTTPPKGAGNYADATAKRVFPAWTALETYEDGFAVAAPVGRFDPNPLGFHDLGGNTWEWCLDSYVPGAQQKVLRGGSWRMHGKLPLMLASYRGAADPALRDTDHGFRVVLDEGAP